MAFYHFLPILIVHHNLKIVTPILYDFFPIHFWKHGIGTLNLVKTEKSEACSEFSETYFPV